MPADTATTRRDQIRKKPLPLEFPGVHHMNEEEIEAAVRLLRSRSLFRYYGVDLQHEVDQFEAEFARFIGARHAVAVSSGTNALATALSALGVGPGQEVIVPAYLWVSVVAAVVNQGAIPVLADVDDTFCLDPAEVERQITARTAGIILVHMSGAPGNAEAIQRIAREHNIFLLEDCAQCAGGSINGRRVGTFGDMGIFSFQMNKNMTCGEGGCVVTNNPELHQRAFACHDLGYTRDQNGRLRFDDAALSLWGRGCRMDELRGAIARVQLRKLPNTIATMHRSKYRIREALAAYPGVKLRRIIDPDGDTGCFLITTYPDPATAKQVNQALIEEGITTYPQGVSNVVMTSWGLHLYYNIKSLVNKTSVDRAGTPWSLAENAGLARDYSKGTCPRADGLFETSILLPIPSCLTEQDESDIIAAFRKVLPQELRATA
jgi:dTDP-4-amino-4,6-dideoxygalactose transaminase